MATVLRFAVDEEPPPLLAAGLALQVVVLILAAVVLPPAIVMRAAGDPEGHLSWMVFAALVTSGLSTIVQARPIGRFGAGYVLFMGTSGAFIAVSTDAVKAGGVPLLATLVVASSIVSFVFADRLAALRRLITPAVGGAILLLIAVSVTPIALGLLKRSPPGAAEESLVSPLIAAVTFVVILAISIFGSPALRLWGPIVGVVAGSTVAACLGAFDFASVAAHAWIGLPDGGWPGLDLRFGTDFWSLAVPFGIVAAIGSIETYGDGVSIQRLSKRKEEPIDFRTVQGAINADGLGNVLAGLAATLPNTTYSTSLSVTDLTGVASRSVGVWGGIFLVLVGFSPKVSSLVMAIPGPIAGSYLMILVILLFLHGLRLVNEAGLTHENGIVVCTSFWLAVGFQNQQIFHSHLPVWSRQIFDNGMASGGLVAIALSALVGLRQGRARNLAVDARPGSVPAVQRFLNEIGAKAGWDRSALLRLELVGGEAFLLLAGRPEPAESDRRVRIVARVVEHEIEVEMTAAASEEAIENAAREIDWDRAPEEDDAGLRILHGLAREVRHDQFHGVEVLVVRVDSRPV